MAAGCRKACIPPERRRRALGAVAREVSLEGAAELGAAVMEEAEGLAGSTWHCHREKKRLEEPLHGTPDGGVEETEHPVL